MYGHKIRLIRIARGLSQEDVAKRLGIKQNTYSNIETNTQKESDEQLQKIAELFGVSIEDIKSPEPIIMNFHNSPHSNGITGNISHNHNASDELIAQLTLQLQQKDSQISFLQELVKNLQK